MMAALSCVDSGFLVLKRFEALYREFAAKTEFNLPIYAVPVFGTDPEQVAVRYRGLDRDAVDGWSNGTLAHIRLLELEREGRVDPLVGLLSDLGQASDVLGWAELECPGTYLGVGQNLTAGTNYLIVFANFAMTDPSL